MKTIKMGYIGSEVQYLSEGLEKNGYPVDSITTFTDGIKQSVIKI